jgi:hypothetical protein
VTGNSTVSTDGKDSKGMCLPAYLHCCSCQQHWQLQRSTAAVLLLL